MAKKRGGPKKGKQIQVAGLGGKRSKIMDGFARGTARRAGVRNRGASDLNREYMDRQAYMEGLRPVTGNDNDP